MKTSIPTTSVHPEARLKYRMIMGEIKEYTKEKGIGWRPTHVTPEGFQSFMAREIAKKESRYERHFFFNHWVASAQHEAWTLHGATADLAFWDSCDSLRELSTPEDLARHDLRVAHIEPIAQKAYVETCKLLEDPVLD